jgi:hypothetical protein
MDTLPELKPGAPIPEELMPPSRPSWKIFLGIAVAILGAAAVLHGHALAQFIGL